MGSFYRICVAIAVWIVTCASFQALADGVKPYALTANDRAILERVENYLTAIHTISAGFIQQSPNGDISSGNFYLQRPGKLRMEYNPPTPVLMVTDGSDLVFYDKELDQVTHVPLEATLVGFLSRDQVKFDSSVIITDMKHADDTISISLVQAKRPKDGTLTLEFSDKPLVLRNMIVTDSSGQTTHVALNQARFDVALDPRLFVFIDPHPGGSHAVIRH
jgi:outer membrane lipoprotein-sorting protein